MKSSKNSDGVEQNVGVFITHELASFVERLSLGQEAGARPTLPGHSCVALVGPSTSVLPSMRRQLGLPYLLVTVTVELT